MKFKIFLLALLCFIIPQHTMARHHDDNGKPTIQNPHSDSMQLITKELEVYNNIQSVRSLAPAWFKAYTQKNLEGIIPDNLRRCYGIEIIQCVANQRLLSIAILLLPALCLFRPQKTGWFFLGISLLLPLTWLLYGSIKLLIFGFTGHPYYAPIEFIFFCTLFMAMLSSVIYVASSPLAVIHQGKVELYKNFRRLGKIMASLDILLFFYEFYEMIKQFFGS